MAINTSTAQELAPGWDNIDQQARLDWVVAELTRVCDAASPLQQHGAERLLASKIAFLLDWKAKLLDSIQAENELQRTNRLVSTYRGELSHLRGRLQGLLDHDDYRNLAGVEKEREANRAALTALANINA